MNAVILAGGFGSRLLPLTENKPKPMIDVNNTPLIDYTLSQLCHFGLRDVVFTLAHMPESIIAWTLGYKRVNCHYSIETQPLGTCGGVKKAAEHLEDSFFVLSGDGISNIDLKRMHNRHIESGAEVTMAVTRVKNPSLYGVVEINAGFVKSFYEKPKEAKSGSYINCGVYIVNKRVLDKVPSTFYDFSKNLFPDMLKDNEKIAVYYHDGYWSDVGDIESYYKANFFLKENVGFFLKEYNAFRTHSKKQSGSIESDFNIKANKMGANHTLVKEGSVVLGKVTNSIIGANCRVLKDAHLVDCIVLDNTIVEGSYTNSIICDKNIIKVKKLQDPQNFDIANNSKFLF